MTTTFKQFLGEMAIVGPDDKNKIESITKFIKRDCQAFLHATQPGSFLYRGIDKNFNTGLGNMYRFKVPTDRNPADSPRWIHDLWNEILQDKTGVQEARSNSIFASTSMKQGSEYMGKTGATYIVFPIGPYQLVWDENVYDTYTHTRDVWARILKNNPEVPTTAMDQAPQLPPETFQMLRQELKDALEEQYDDLQSSAFSGKEHEVMIITREYYAINIGRSAGKVDRDQEAFIKGLSQALWS